MKTKNLLFIAATAILLVSCGTSQKDAIKYLENVADQLEAGCKKSGRLKYVKTAPDEIKIDTAMAPALHGKTRESYLQNAENNRIKAIENMREGSKKYESMRVEFVTGLDSAIAGLNRLKPVADGEALKGAALELLNTYKTKAQTEYKQLVQLYLSEDRDATKYTSLRDAITNTMGEKYHAYKKEQDEFGKKYNIKIKRDFVNESLYGNNW